MSDLQSFVKSIQGGTLKVGSNEFLSTANPILDAVIGGNGIPAEKITMVYGVDVVGRQYGFQQRINECRLTSVEPDTTASQPVNPESGAG